MRFFIACLPVLFVPRMQSCEVIERWSDGLLREAFRIAPSGDDWLLREGQLMLDAYMTARLGDRER